MTNRRTQPDQAEPPLFIPLTQEMLDAGLDDATIDLLRSYLNVKAFEQELGRLIHENPQQESSEQAA